MKIKVLVATHKMYDMPNDSAYVPIFVGKANHPSSDIPFTGDDTGNNISKKNPSYNELTALYWGWKNLDYDALGLIHYRRYLSLNHSKRIDKAPLDSQQIKKLFQKNDIILPKLRHYFVESNESHYRHAHYNEPLNIMGDVIAELYPDYKDSYDLIMKKTSAHMFNMFIMKKKPLNEYCEWMFSILHEVENRTDITMYDTYEKRVYGFLSELLLDVWLKNNSQYKCVEVNYTFMEHQNWLKKGGNFLLRKLKGNSLE